MDNTYTEKWQAAMKEYNAKAERLDVEKRLRYNKWYENMQTQFAAIGDWTEAMWDEFMANAEQQWHDMVISNSEGETKAT